MGVGVGDSVFVTAGSAGVDDGAAEGVGSFCARQAVSELAIKNTNRNLDINRLPITTSNDWFANFGDLWIQGCAALSGC